ncbi:LysR family transcriptional regulator [Luteibacter aegosomatissinici]|uniref:LysR substrate-binding domain-containing protein n=1 Tax=Luteibacter aegosomatissinici TaxID=2911539 RepID=UPI001FFA7814|nr:LysR family transcriptional regulator [Luteibacter aegosomatissinici]UPG95901.1 LysR family transcriptional regulator [Luteibacter aegosomatissinici]
MEFIQLMRVFSKLAELGSFTKVSDAMEIGRPQVTVAIQELENKLGVRLFQRTTRKVSLTQEGESFYQRAEEILRSVSEISTMFGTSGAPPTGRVRLNISAALAQQKFIDLLMQFHKIHPGIELILGVTDRAVDLISEGVDCALRIGELRDSSMVARRIGNAVMVTCASPSYLAEFGNPSSIEDLPSHRSVSFVSGMSNRPLPWNFSINGEDRTYTGRGSISANESKAYIRCGLAGFGIIQAPGIAVDKHLASGALVAILEDIKPAPRPISLIYPTRSHLAPHIQIFFNWLAERFASIDDTWIESQT